MIPLLIAIGLIAFMCIILVLIAFDVAEIQYRHDKNKDREDPLRQKSKPR